MKVSKKIKKNNDSLFKNNIFTVNPSLNQHIRLKNRV